MIEHGPNLEPETSELELGSLVEVDGKSLGTPVMFGMILAMHRDAAGQMEAIVYYAGTGLTDLSRIPIDLVRPCRKESRALILQLLKAMPEKARISGVDTLLEQAEHKSQD